MRRRCERAHAGGIYPHPGWFFVLLWALVAVVAYAVHLVETA
jgi:hypothetical protein